MLAEQSFPCFVRGCLLLLLCGFCFPLQAQRSGILNPVSVKDGASAMIQVENGAAYVMTGIWGDTLGAATPDSAFLLKLNYCGCTVWDRPRRFYAGAGNAILLDLIQLPSGGYVAAGLVESPDSLVLNFSLPPFPPIPIVLWRGMAQKLWMIRTDAQGNLQGQKIWSWRDLPHDNTLALGSNVVFASPASNAWGIALHPNGDLYLTGRVLHVQATVDITASIPPVLSLRDSSVSLDAFLLRTDTTASFGLKSFSRLNRPNSLRWGTDVSTSGQDLLISGQALDSPPPARSYATLTRVTANGLIIWDSVYFASHGNQQGVGAFAVDGSAIALTGARNPLSAPAGELQAFMMQADYSTGRVLSYRSYPIPGTNTAGFGLSSFAGGYWMAGMAGTAGKRGNSAWVVKTDMNFNPVATVALPAGDSVALFRSVHGSCYGSQWGFAAAGLRYNPARNDNFANADILFANSSVDEPFCRSNGAHTDFYGGIIIQIDDINEDLFCSLPAHACTGLGIQADGLNRSPFSIFPNPSQGKLHIEWRLDVPAPVMAVLLDLQGRMVLQQTWPAAASGRHHLDLGAQAAGLYLLRLQAGAAQRSFRVQLQ